MINLRKTFTDALEFVNNKYCIIRLDLNVPKVENKFTDLTRLEKIIPTLTELSSRGAKTIIISHMGRPDGLNDKDLSLKALSTEIEKNLNRKVEFCNEDIFSKKIEQKIKSIKPSTFLLLENIRFYSQEESNESTFSKRLSSFGDIYINESFSCSHRSHASIEGIPRYLPSFPGKLFEDELRNMGKLMKGLEIDNNSITILGGAKISSKLNIIENLAQKFSKILIGGAMANTFLASKGINIGKSLSEFKMENDALEILNKYDSKIILPEDVILVKSIDDKENFASDVQNINSDMIIVDIGPRTRKRYYNEILKSSSVLWNGPLGLFEKPPFDNGTKYVGSAIKNFKSKRSFSAAGGGDTISCLKQTNVIDYFDFISTGGGAFLELIEGKMLPGIEILNN